MIVVVVIGILSIIAVPSYRSYTMRANRTEAKKALLAIQIAQERYYLVNHTYGNIDALEGLGITNKSENGVYTLVINPANTITYTATATPTPGGGTNGVDMTIDTQCPSFSIDAQGVRTPIGNRCW